MASVLGIPTSRVSDIFRHYQVNREMSASQAKLLELQRQLTEGTRYVLPSDAPSSSMRVISMQQLLERKGHVQTSLQTTQSFLTASESSLSEVAGHVTDVRALALGAISDPTDPASRSAAAIQVREALEQVMTLGNTEFRGRNLFAGADTDVTPFTEVDGFVKYVGDEHRLQSLGDIALLIDTNLTGSEVFGAVSEPVRGSVDPEPHVTAETLLDDLHDGEGVSGTRFMISDGTTTATVDISTAESVGDVAKLIQKANLGGTQIDVEITDLGLNVSIDAGDLSIIDEFGSTTARELGIAATSAGTGPVVGQALDPKLTPQTKLSDAFGRRAHVYFASAGRDNDFYIEAASRGEAIENDPPTADEDLNGVQINLIDDATVLDAGAEYATYDPVAKQLDVYVRNGYTQARHVVAAVNALHAGGTSPFVGRLDAADEENSGSGIIDPGLTGTTAGGEGVEVDLASGLQITNGGATYVVDVSTAETFEDLVNLLNTSGAHVLAEISPNGDGIDVRSRLSGSDFMIGENGGETATHLGLRSMVDDTLLADLNNGRGVHEYDGGAAAAKAEYPSVGPHNNLRLEARGTGPEWNEFEIEFVDAAGPAGSEYVTYDEAGKKITIGIVPGVTTAQQAVDLFYSVPGARDDFDLILADEGDVPNTGEGFVYTGKAETAGGTAGGVDFIIRRNDGLELEIDIHTAKTVGDVIDLINNNPENIASGVAVTARLAEYGNGIELVDNNPGTSTMTFPGSRELSVERVVGSTAAIDLGFVPIDEESSVRTTPGTVASAVVQFPTLTNNDLLIQSRGVGELANDVTIEFVDTTLGAGSETYSYDNFNKVLTFGIDPATTTANMIVDLFNNTTPPLDQVAYDMFTVQLDPADGTPNDGTSLLEPATATMSGGTPDLLTGRDTNPRETDGLFTALQFIEQGLSRDEDTLVNRGIEMLDTSFTTLTYYRSELGVRQRGIDALTFRLGEESVELQSNISDEYDVDFAETLSQLTAQQTAFEAILRTTSTIMRASLIDYL